MSFFGCTDSARHKLPRPRGNPSAILRKIVKPNPDAIVDTQGTSPNAEPFMPKQKPKAEDVKPGQTSKHLARGGNVETTQSCLAALALGPFATARALIGMPAARGGTPGVSAAGALD